LFYKKQENNYFWFKSEKDKFWLGPFEQQITDIKQFQDSIIQKNKDNLKKYKSYKHLI